MIRIVVVESGKVARARILDADEPRLGAAALAAPKKWLFSPALVPRARGFFCATGSRGIRYDPALADGDIVRGFLTNNF